MERGTGYTHHSTVQAQGFKDGEAKIKQAMARNALLVDPSLEVIRVADLGCSHGSNAIHAVDFVAREIIELRDLKLSSSSSSSLEIQAIFSDITANDFNTLFSLVPHLQGKPYFFSGVPGSFYLRLFPRSSIHFAMTTFALHSLSKIPEEITNKESPAWNKGTMYIDRSSPQAAIEAVVRQAKEDLQNFLQCRAQELVTGGLLVSKFLIRTTRDLEGPLHNGFQEAWKDLIQEGIISQESLDTFNFPVYFRSCHEVQDAL
ncbi:hypothetical protein SELMODRAFT_24064, partial [Selaginella moellendorffii]